MLCYFICEAIDQSTDLTPCSLRKQPTCIYLAVTGDVDSRVQWTRILVDEHCISKSYLFQSCDFVSGCSLVVGYAESALHSLLQAQFLGECWHQANWILKDGCKGTFHILESHSSVYNGNMQLAFQHVIGTRVICFVWLSPAKNWNKSKQLVFCMIVTCKEDNDLYEIIFLCWAWNIFLPQFVGGSL